MSRHHPPRPLFTTVIFLLIAFFSISAVSADPLDGIVTGKVSNGTANGIQIEGDLARLFVFDVSQKQQVGERTTSVDSLGRFRFEDLDRDPNTAYFLVVQHDGITYPYATPFQMKDQPELVADIRVFDTTRSEEAIRFDRVNLLVTEVDGGMLNVVQMGAVSNVGDRTFVATNVQDGALGRALRIALPMGSLGVRMQAGFRDEDLLDGVGGVQVASPLKPGRQEFALSFQVPYTGTSADLTLQLPYSASTVQAYVPGGGPRLESELLKDAGRAEMGGQAFQLYSGTNISSGTVVGARLLALPFAGEGGLAPNQLALMSLGIALLVLSVGVLTFAWHSRSAPDDPAGASPAQGLEEERARLVLKLAELDDGYASGSISYSEYQAERTRGKQRLVNLTQTLRGNPSPS